ncbi:MAG: PIG-L family deacetylase [Planctomycetes bacterium]|nr:PIG-L family deacetylase [Planctomycetota bacterium]
MTSLLVLSLSLIVSSPPGGEGGVIALRQALQDVTTDYRLLAVAAHPDDEDLATLVVLRRRDGVRTDVALGTRGEGGQDEIGPELYRSLGVVRTREMEEAAAIHGAQVHYLDLADFGFSKTADETFGIWGKDEALRRLVRIIRRVRPQVMISNHDTKSGHGNHQVMGRAMIDAFERAADPAFAPELGAPWAVAKCYVRSPRSRANVVIESQERDPTRGVTYFDLAAEALRHHRSQGTWDSLIGGEDGARGYERVLTRVGTGNETSLFDHVPTLVDRLRTSGASAEARALDDITAQFRSVAIPSHPEALAPWIAGNLTRVRSLAGGARDRDVASALQDFAGRIEQALICSLGARIDVAVKPAIVVPGEPVRVTARFTSIGTPLDSVRLGLSGPLLGASIAAPSPADSHDLLFAGRLDAGVTATRPVEDHLYDYDEDRPALEIRANCRVSGADVSLSKRLPLDVTSAIEVEVSPRILLMRGGVPAMTAVRLHNRLERPWTGRLVVSGREPLAISLPARGEASQTIELASSNAPVETRTIQLVADGVNTPVSSTDVTTRMANVSVAPGLRVGVVETYDRTASDALRALRVDSRTLAAADLATGDLQSFDTIVVDLRGYGVRPDLRENARRLVEYVKNGGHLVVFYQKPGDWKSEYAPLPLLLSSDRVTVETAPVKILLPDHALMSIPNRIYAEDFEGWVQERGLYFSKEHDSAYEELLAMADPGEKELRGGVLFCRAGRGSFIYTSLVWYRQLRELHEGALKAFANFISYPKIKEP